MSKATRIVSAMEPSEPRAAGELLPVVYHELRRLAAYRLAHEKPGQTLQATALVHEAYLRLLHSGCGEWENPRHFFNAAAEAMRRILIEIARRKRSVKHGGGLKRTDLSEFDVPVSSPPEELLALDEALGRLAQVHPEEAQVVKLRYFMGMTQDEVARVLGVSRRTVNSRWAFARAWLYRAMRPDAGGPL